MANEFRLTPSPSADNTFRTKQQDNQSPAYAASIALQLDADLTQVKVGQLTGALTLTANVGSATTPPYVGDKVEILLSSDASARVVTFGTGFASAGTLSVTASKKAIATFIFDGAAWIEQSRAVTA